MRPVRLGSVMQLPQVLHSRSVMNNLPGCGTGSLSCAVIDHPNPGMERPNQCLWVGRVGAVMGYKKKINRAEKVVRAGQFQFLLLREVAKVEESEPAIRDQYAHRTGVLSRILGCHGLGFAIGISFAGSRQGICDVFPSRGEYADLNSFDGQRPSRLYRYPGMSGDGFLVSGIIS